MMSYPEWKRNGNIIFASLLKSSSQTYLWHRSRPLVNFFWLLTLFYFTKLVFHLSFHLCQLFYYGFTFYLLCFPHLCNASLLNSILIAVLYVYYYFSFARTSLWRAKFSLWNLTIILIIPRAVLNPLKQQRGRGHHTAHSQSSTWPSHLESTSLSLPLSRLQPARSIAYPHCTYCWLSPLELTQE
jgi:hypothetical protein